jgi:DNA-binding LytR/AlgR family response regulator
MQSLKILIIEDEVLVAQDLSNLLTDWGYRVVDCCKTGEEAVESFKLHEPDLVLADVQLKGVIDGVETVRQINEIKRVPVIFITAQADHQTVVRAKLTGPASYLLKPFNERNLNISLEIALNNFYQQVSNVNNSQESDRSTVSANDVKLVADVILRKDNMIFIKQNYRFVKLLIDDLVYMESDKNYTNVVFKQQKIVLRLSLQTVLEKFANCDSVIRVHRSYVVNLAHVEEFSENEIILPKNKLIPLTAAYKEDFLSKFSVL